MNKAFLITFSLLLVVLSLVGQTTLWNFSTNQEGWSFDNHVTGSVSDGILQLNINGNDPYIGSPGSLNIPALDYKYFIIRMQNSTTGTGANLFWTTSAGLSFTSMSVIANDDSMRYYILDLSKNPDWKGTIKSLRFDPAGSSGRVHIDFIKLTGTYASADIVLPVTMEAENYNLGGEGNAFHDNTPGNEGNQYRLTGDVDIKTTTDTVGNYHVRMESKEWMEYMIKVPGKFKYFFDMRIASHADSNQIHLELNGQNIGEPFITDNTSGAWTSIRQEIELPQGIFVLRLVADYCKDVLNINNLKIIPYTPPVSFSIPGETGSYKPGADASLVVSVSEDIADSVRKVAFYHNDQKLSEDETAPYEHVISAIEAGYYNIKAIALDESGTPLDTAITELFAGNSKVGIRPLPRGTMTDIDKNLWPNNPGGYFVDLAGQYPFVASHMDVITPNDFNCNFKGDFRTRQAFFEHYLPFDRDWIDTNPNTNPLVQKIRQVEKYGFSVKHILICREAELYGSGKWGPFPEDSRILYQRDVDDFRQVFQNAFTAGIIEHNNYKLIQMCISPSFYYQSPEARSIIKSMDGVCLESHQYNVHWPLDQGIEKDLQATGKGIRWTLANELDYVFYYGPWLSQSCSQYYDDVVRDWLYKYWEAGMPKHHDRMHFYLNNFPHDCGAQAPVGPETDPHSTTGFAKWLIEEVGRQEAYPEPDPDDEETGDQKPYHGTPVSIPSKVEAEDFDAGGIDVAYLDKTSINEGGAYRIDEGVDIHAAGSGYMTGWLATDEWMEYTIDVDSSGYYLLNIQYFTLLENQKIQFSVDGKNITDIINLPFTDGIVSNYEDKIYLTSGIQVLRVYIIYATGGLDLDFYSITRATNTSTLNIKKESFSIYPNPANETLSILHGNVSEKLADEMWITIKDLQGRTLLSKVLPFNSIGPETNSINISHIKTGAYIITVKCQNKIYTKKFLKE